MITSSTADEAAVAVRHAAAICLGEPIDELEPLSGGRNSRVYRARGRSGRAYAVKQYFRHPLDGRDRLAAEVAALRFLRAQGIEHVPEVLGADPSAGCAVYEYVDGRPVDAISDGDINRAVAFLTRLWAMRGAPGAGQFAAASEACVALDDYVRHLDRRLRRLPDVADGSAVRDALLEFVRQELRPAHQRLGRWFSASAKARGWEPAAPLTAAQRTLSPSDFGLHNALRRGDELVFLDFEYFGWDDPAKMTADMLLHPAMAMTEAQRQRVVDGLAPVFGRDFAARLQLAYPLCGLKWSLILLNEFVAQDRLRRDFAQAVPDDEHGRLSEQLTKARVMLARIEHADEHFPYRVA